MSVVRKVLVAAIGVSAATGCSTETQRRFSPSDGGDASLLTKSCSVPPNAPARIRVARPSLGLTCERLPTPLDAPRDVIETRDGTIFVTEMASGSIARLEGTSFVRVATNLVSPIGLREASDGALFVVEENAHRLSRVDRATGSRTTVVEALGNATYMTIGPDGNAYVSAFVDLTTPSAVVHRIDVSTPDAGVTSSIFAKYLTVPEGLAFDAQGRLHVAEWGTKPSRIVRVPQEGGSALQGEVTANEFSGLYGLARHPRGDGFVAADVAGDRVVHVHASGATENILVDVAAPAGLWFAANGDLWIAEHGDGDTHTSIGYLIRVSHFN